jgi:hypothetical protein
MRPGQQNNNNNNNNNKRMRGRNRKGPNPLTRSYESNGGDVKLRGTALHIAEKYVQLARDAQSSGDRVAAENYFQHAEHYYRIVAAAQAQMPSPQPVIRNDEGDEEDDGDFRVNGNNDRQPMGAQGNQPGYGGGDQQPYLNGAAEGDDEGEGGDNNPGDGFPPTRDMGNGNNTHYQQGRPQQGNGQGHGGGGQGQQGQFRRRRPFRERFNDGNRNGNSTNVNGGERIERGEGDGGPGGQGPSTSSRPNPSSESNDD